jgi:hypothetical protein
MKNAFANICDTKSVLTISILTIEITRKCICWYKTYYIKVKYDVGHSDFFF